MELYGTEDVPNEMLEKLCEHMSIDELYNFVQGSKRNYDICNDVLQDKINKEINRVRLISKNKILLMLNNMRPGQILDATNYRIDERRGIMNLRVISRPRSSLDLWLEFDDYPNLFIKNVNDKKNDELIKIMVAQ